MDSAPLILVTGATGKVGQAFIRRVISSSDEGDPTGPLAPGPQIQPQIVNGVGVCNGGVASSPHTGAINVALGDGSVRSVTGSISTATWWFALTPNGGEVLGSDWTS